MKIAEATLNSILQGQDRLVIPRYQREFKWEEEESKEFFSDLKNAIESNNPLFMGTLIFSHQGDGVLEIVDGQQRLTTIMILHIACRNYIRRKGKKADDLVDHIQRRLTLDFATFGEEHQARLEPSGRIAPAFSYMATRNWSGEYEKEMGHKVGWNRLAKVYDHFIQQLETEKYDIEEMRNLLTCLGKTKIVEITVEEGQAAAIETFERVNARGAHLAVYDLVKAYLFAKLSEAEEVDIEKEWKEIVKYAEDSENNLKKLLYQFHFSQKGYVHPRNLYRSLKIIADLNVNTFLENLKDFAKFYAIIRSFTKAKESIEFNSELKRYLINDRGLSELSEADRLRRVQYSISVLSAFGVVSVYPLVYASLISLSNSDKSKKTIDAWIDLLEFLEKFSFMTTSVTHVSSKYGGSLQKLYSDYCDAYANNKIPFTELTKQLKTDFKATIPAERIEDEFIAKFSQLSYADYEVVIYVYDQLNRLSTKQKNRQTLPGNTYNIWSTEGLDRNDTSVEHIWPQSKELELETPDLVDSIGNLIVIHRKDNSALGDMDPAVKLQSLKDDIAKGEIQNKPYLEDFLSKYGSADWNEKVISERASDLARSIFKICKY